MFGIMHPVISVSTMSHDCCCWYVYRGVKGGFKSQLSTHTYIMKLGDEKIETD